MFSNNKDYNRKNYESKLISHSWITSHYKISLLGKIIYVRPFVCAQSYHYLNILCLSLKRTV